MLLRYNKAAIFLCNSSNNGGRGGGSGGVR